MSLALDPSAGVIACLLALSGLAFVDGIYVHLVREKLHRRPETRLEHLVHTGRAALFAPILVTFFGGASIALGIALLAADQLLETVDMAIERRSRAYSGGLRSSEYLLHGAALTIRGAGVAFAVTAGAPSAALLATIDVLLPGAIAGAILHVVLLFRLRPVGRRAVA